MMNGKSRHKNQNISENSFNGYSNGFSGSSSDGYATIPTSSSISSSPSNGKSFSGLNYIEHPVTKMDTLAGVAIKYGVEVADIRRMNGLVTDLQMFALETLRIPLPGRHPPSPILSNGLDMNGEHTPTLPQRQPQDELLESFQCIKLKPPRRVTPAMSSLQGYYRPKKKKPPSVQGTEMSVYKTNKEPSTSSDPSKGQHRKSRSLVSLQNGDFIADESIRRRQKADSSTDASLQTPVMVSGFLGKIAATKSPIGDFLSDVFVSMRKSSSTSNLQESDNPASSLRTKPMSAWRNKAALD